MLFRSVIDLADEEDSVVALTARRTVLYKLVDRLLSQLKVGLARFRPFRCRADSLRAVYRRAVLLIHDRPDDRAARFVCERRLARYQSMDRRHLGDDQGSRV